MHFQTNDAFTYNALFLLTRSHCILIGFLFPNIHRSVWNYLQKIAFLYQLTTVRSDKSLHPISQNLGISINVFIFLNIIAISIAFKLISGLLSMKLRNRSHLFCGLIRYTRHTRYGLMPHTISQCCHNGAFIRLALNLIGMSCNSVHHIGCVYLTCGHLILMCHTIGVVLTPQNQCICLRLAVRSI